MPYVSDNRASRVPAPSPLVRAFQTIFSVVKGTTRKAFNLAGYPSSVPSAMRPSFLTTLRSDRKGVTEDVRRLSVKDPRIDGSLENSVSDATIRGFQLVPQNSVTTADALERRANRILAATKERLKMDGETEDWARRLVRDGDLFGQILLDHETGEIAELCILDSSITHPCKDERGQWKEGPERAYFQTDGVTDVPVQWFAEWEVVHVKWKAGKADLYGRSQFRSALTSAHILERAEEDLAIRRRARTGLKFHHEIQGTWEDVERYKAENKETLDRPYDVLSDFFSNQGVKINPLIGDPGISDLGDIELFQTNEFAAGRFPKELLGYGTGLDGGLLELVVGQYLRYLWRIDEKLEEFIRGVNDRALLFQGVNPEAIEYEVVWGPKDEDSVDARIARGVTLRQAGAVSMETFLKICDVPGVTWEVERERMLKEMEDFPFPPLSLAMGRPALPSTVPELMVLYPHLFGLQPDGQGANGAPPESSGDAPKRNGNGATNGKTPPRRGRS